VATATFVQEGASIDYTPSSAVAEGDVVVQGDLVAVAVRPIEADRLGALAAEGVFDFPKGTGSASAIAAGKKVYWDAGNEVATETVGSNKYIGKTVLAATDDDDTVRVRMSQ
jgi:predicted RecA/RadA family phage recombinase